MTAPIVSKQQKEPPEDRQGSREHRLTERDKNHSGDHGIAHMAVDALRHELLPGLPGSERALADRHEQPDCGDLQQESQANAESTDHGENKSRRWAGLPETE
jgi:hypothetical protein